ncbi:MAG TPA: PP2C family serine/threonine-protein phosphatase [Polyangia bacterium]|nr:PP2C family serine/threonine-protein phosphatase [Polyangia bacterium]
MKLIAWGLTDVGRKRDHNEDTFLAEPELGLFAVADGMGGHLGGDRASRMAVEIVRREVDRARRNGLAQVKIQTLPPGIDAQSLAKLETPPPPAALLREATRAASTAIYDLAQADPQLQGMGTTLTTLFVYGERAFLSHVGDSRAYLYRDGKVQQLTEDHSWIHEQVKAGLLSVQDARDSKFKHIITRSVGFERDVLVDLHHVAIGLGDCLLLCSDGLANYLEPAELASVLTAHYYRRVPGLLVELANERGGEDNITVVLVYVANDAPA